MSTNYYNSIILGISIILAKDHIITWSNPKDTVLDIFAGSGTTLRMAKALNRKYIGFEISKEYFKLANKLIKKQENFDD